MKTFFLYFFVFIFLLTGKSLNAQGNKVISLFPTAGAENINPDTQLKIMFKDKPSIGKSGFVRIYDAKSGKLVDSLDLSILAGPSQPDMIRKKEADYTKVPYKYESTNYTNANTLAGTPSGTAMPDTVPYQLNIIGRFTDGFHFYPIIIEEIQPKYIRIIIYWSTIMNIM